MRWHALHVLDDDTARDLALVALVEFEGSELDRLAPLVDAALVWLDGAARERIITAVVESLWSRELRDVIEEGLELAAQESRRMRRTVAAARADLDAAPSGSRLARAVVDQAAEQRAFELQLPVGCLHCLEEGIGRAPEPERVRRVLLVARMAGHAAGVPDDELRAAATEETAPALALASDVRRADVRWWLRRIAMLGQESIPHISAALLELLDEPLPPVEEDEVWHEAVAGLTRRVALGLP